MILELMWRRRVAVMATGVTALAAVMRFTSLSTPKKLVFDELYYARGAYSVLTMGYEGQWGGEKGIFAEGDYSGLSTNGDYVVHPMVGKLLIALGMKIAGTGPFGWRLASAVVGTLTVLIVALLARSMLRSTLWGAVAGVLLAVDGQHIVLSRTALLDIFLTFFVTLGLALLWLDRLRARRIYERNPAADARATGPSVGVRWWRLAALVSFGLACGTKWSGAYFALGFLLMSVAWDALDRRAAGYRRWLLGTFWRTGVPGLVNSVIIIPSVYLATWANWFLTQGSYNRNWAEKHPDFRISWMPAPLQSLLHYHAQMLDFHRGLDSPHPYESHPNGWIVQFRPTAFRYESVDVHCGGHECVESIYALGNPLIWWAGLAALCFAVWRLVLARDVMGLWMSIGVLAGWLPWVPYAHRTIFTFYSVAMSPFVVLLVAWALARLAQPDPLHGRFSRRGLIQVGAYLVAVLVLTAFFTPLWFGTAIPHAYWEIHMWSPTWA